MKNSLLILLLTAATLFAQTNEGPIVTAIDGYAAQVGSTIITYGEIRENVAPFMQQLHQQYKGLELAQRIQNLYLETRESLIEEALIKAEAQENGLALPPHVIDDEVDRLIRERFNDDRVALTLALAARRMTFDEWREDVSDQITLRVYYSQEVTRLANVSKEAVRKEYEKNKESLLIPFAVKFRVILINKGSTEEDRAVKKQQAETVLKTLLDGADFAEVAKEVSEGIRADNGGAFPWSDPKDIREELRPALHTVAAGKISDLIETDEEFYIVKIEERREEGYIAFEEVRKKIETQLLRREQDRLHKELMDRLTQRHFVKRY